MNFCRNLWKKILRESLTVIIIQVTLENPFRIIWVKKITENIPMRVSNKIPREITKTERFSEEATGSIYERISEGSPVESSYVIPGEIFRGFSKRIRRFKISQTILRFHNQSLANFHNKSKEIYTKRKLNKILGKFLLKFSRKYLKEALQEFLEEFLQEFLKKPLGEFLKKQPW